MNERTTEVLEQYELEVQSKRRGRGAWICETSQGLKLLREYKGTVKRLEFEEQIMNVLQNQKTCRTDQYMRNREGELLSVAEDGTRCVVKEWFSGRECSVQSEAEVVRAVGRSRSCTGHCAALRSMSRGIWGQFSRVRRWRRWSATTGNLSVRGIISGKNGVNRILRGSQRKLCHLL